MRTREQVLAVSPEWDILVWTHGRFERHSRIRTLPEDPEALFPTEAADLVTILPGRSNAELIQLMAQFTGKAPTNCLGEDHYKRLWFMLRHMPMTVGKSLGRPIPRNFTVMPEPRAPRTKTARSSRSGASMPDTKRGTKKFTLLYQPGAIEARDVAFVNLAPGAQEILRAIFSIRKTKFTRAELVKALQNWAPLQHTNPWVTFARYRPILVRAQFISADVKPKGK